MPVVTISLAQMNVRDGDPRKNWATVQEFVNEAARRGSDMLVLPELWDNGFALDRAKDIASNLAGGLFAQVAALARSSKLVILGSMLEKRGIGVYNCAAVFTPLAGVTGAYRKIHLFDGMNEPQYLSPGEAPLTTDLPWGTTSIAICYDLRFPELMRRYAVDGAKLLVIPAQWPEKRINHWRVLLQARAIENQFFVAACNRVGEYNSNRFPGHSMVVDPLGNIVAEVGDSETMMTVKIDTDMVTEVRTSFPVLQDRKPALYG
jgi:predicted amidohydrolase